MLLLLAAAIAACGPKRPTLPRINSEQRNMLLNVRLNGDPAFTQRISSIVKDQLEKLYFNEMIMEPVITARTIDQLSTRLFFDLVVDNIDDLIIVEGDLNLQGDKLVLVGAIKLWNVTLAKEIFAEPIKVMGLNTAESFPPKLRWEIERIMSLRFSEPGAYPRTDIVRAADLLFQQEEFPLAQELYRKALDKNTANTVFARRERSMLKDKIRECDDEIRKRGLVLDVGKSLYKEEFHFHNITPALQQAFLRAFESSALRQELRNITNSQVEIYIQWRTVENPGKYPSYSGLSVHFHVRFNDRLYRDVVKQEKRYVRGNLAISLNAYAPLMLAVNQFKIGAMDASGHPETRDTISKANVFIHLTRLTGDQVSFEVKTNKQNKIIPPTIFRVWLREYEGQEIPTVDDDATLRSGYYLIPSNEKEQSAPQKYLIEFFGLHLF
jgi:hypothetical protein